MAEQVLQRSSPVSQSPEVLPGNTICTLLPTWLHFLSVSPRAASLLLGIKKRKPKQGFKTHPLNTSGRIQPSSLRGSWVLFLATPTNRTSSQSVHGVEDTAAECERLGATVGAFVVDCSKREEIYSAAEKVKKDIGDVSILVNNAGVITAADLLSTQDHQIERMFEVNILAHMWTTRAFLPTMMNNNHGHIVTVASAAGHLVTSFMVAYCSSKFAAVGFHKALTEELSTLGKDGIKTTCLCPVFINTGFVKNPSTRLGKILEIEEVVEALMEGILTNQKMVFVPSNQRVALLFERLFPERALNVLKKLTDVKFDAVVGQRSTQ
ncbi:PREDICTED: estradiol 17-beta-dehydrogenase 11-like [Calidris pugnax]|uniref:estradiol 17-beta-dehydrogenase 11-like n=1 Tax=Calidris pugnax TaxID=198806 RepID=UPI00071D7E23|nr:PREDICTED: estradiol 17-beta-dehydrogenase 11-like [Calidris pugnax]